MRNLLIMAVVLLGLGSCEKDDPTPTVDCDCGIVTSKIIYTPSIGRVYVIGADNNCSGLTKEFEVPFDTYTRTDKGSEFCTSDW